MPNGEAVTGPWVLIEEGRCYEEFERPFRPPVENPSWRTTEGDPRNNSDLSARKCSSSALLSFR
jgi:hypothetical protein